MAANPGVSREEALARIYAEAEAETARGAAASVVPSALTFADSLLTQVPGSESSVLVGVRA